MLLTLLVKVTSRGPVLFRQERMGRRFQPFWICKFRTMTPDAPAAGRLITVRRRSPHHVRVGRILRKTKLDELPQFFNVLRGDMSLVGPARRFRRYVEMFRPDYQDILQVRPGLTDMASLKYLDEAALLGKAEDPERIR